MRPSFSRSLTSWAPSENGFGAMRHSWPKNNPSAGICWRTDRAASADVNGANDTLCSHLSGAKSQPLIGGQFIEPHWAARTHFVGADADFRAHAEFPAIGEPRRRIPINRCGI